ncbi:MAG: hypothetical protein RLP44_07770 [Aggregatilineales bacterium]
MSEASVTQSRPDMDILADIHHVERGYPPLVNDRHQVNFEVNDGVVTVSGYTKATPTYNYTLGRVADIDGVKEVIAHNFFNDETIRLDVGRTIPVGVVLSVEYGTVILAGKLPDGTTIEEVVREVGLVEGVRRVITEFR